MSVWTGDQERRGARDQLNGGSYPEPRLRSCRPHRPGLSSPTRPSSNPHPVHTTSQTCWKNYLTTKPPNKALTQQAGPGAGGVDLPSSQHPRETQAGSVGIRRRLGSPKTTGLREGDWGSSHLLSGALGPQCAPKLLSTLHRKQPDRPRPEQTVFGCQMSSRVHLASIVRCATESRASKAGPEIIYPRPSPSGDGVLVWTVGPAKIK